MKSILYKIRFGYFCGLLVSAAGVNAADKTFPNHPSENNSPEASEMRIISEAGKFTFIARNTSYREAISILALLANAKVEIVDSPTMTLIVEYRETTPEKALLMLLNSPKLKVERVGGKYLIKSAP